MKELFKIGDALTEDERKKLEKSNLLPETHKEKNEAAQPASENGAEVNPETYSEMLKYMRDVAKRINDNKEIQDNGFLYPMEWLEAFEKKINEALDRGETPDLGIIGYGSLQNPGSLSNTLKNNLSGPVRMKGVKRGFYFAAAQRPKQDWKHLGLGYQATDAVVSVKHEPEASCNGVRIPLGTDKENLEKLKTREFSYEILPGPPAEGADGKIAELNLICWPRGRSLTDEMYPKRMNTIKDLPVKPENIHITTLSPEETDTLFTLDDVSSQRGYIQAKRSLAKDSDKENLKKLEVGIAQAYKKKRRQFL